MMISSASQPTPSSFKKAGLFFISENYLPDPLWEAVHYKPQQMQFPFFSSEPLVIVLELYAPFLQQSRALLKELQELKLQTQLIFFSLDVPEKEILNLFNICRPFRLIKTNNIKELQSCIQEAIEQAQHQKQEQVLYELFQEQNKELKKISQNLEDRIEKRQTHLEEAKAKLFATNEKNLFLQNALFAIHNSVDIPDLEKKVTSFLKTPFHVNWFRIYFGTTQMNNLNEKNSSLHLYRFSLLQGETEYGQLVFARDQGAPFRRDERDFLDQMCEAISLCLERMLQIERNKDLQSQWQSTFNAILDPVCLIDEDYNLRLANKSLSDSQNGNVVGQKCYQILFQRSSVCPNCQRGQSFRLRDQSNNPRIFDVFSQSMSIDYQRSYFHLYRDISQQLGLERQLVESAKMAELGTISSSIAHELNNPLGGMINFIQLIKMDLKQEDPLFTDINEMETAAQRCKEIIKNLLGFSRISHESETQSVSLFEIIQRAIMITELRTRSLGVRIDCHQPNEKIIIQGRFNPLAQVFCNVLQNAYESILEKRKKVPNFIGRISIEMDSNSKMVEVKVFDDGLGLPKNSDHHYFDPLFTTKDPSKHSGLGLTLARQILTEHSAQIELTSEKDGKTCVQIHFPRLSSDPF
jgi:two-component system, NtrC family, sensor kinase